MLKTVNKHLIKTYFHKNITIEHKQLQIPTNEILTYLQPDKFNSLCKEGCSNFNKKWTCPPNCPPFTEYAKNFSQINLHLFYTRTDQFNFIEAKNRGLKAYNFIKEELQSYLHDIESENNIMIAANSCEICSPCALASGKNCPMPEKIRYNLVAFGFNVNAIMNDLFQYELKWLDKDKAPDYISSLAAILQK
ncbi:DUF2284 domain-containing protein [Marinifilum sp. RC60d5]|uniref:DUF2284 domain-containing protein n=1 Tax=Marinifilum sp. RC60d5 TaxID=3458414 RepID=UPI0040358078